MSAEPAQIGIVIATRNRRTRLLETLDRLKRLHARTPLCVVDNGSTDGTPAAVESGHPDVRLIGLGRNAGAAARNIGAAALPTPLWPALRRTGALVRADWASGRCWIALGHALRGLPWVLRDRRLVPAAVEHAVAALERR